MPVSAANQCVMVAGHGLAAYVPAAAFRTAKLCLTAKLWLVVAIDEAWVRMPRFWPLQFCIPRIACKTSIRTNDARCDTSLAVQIWSTLPSIWDLFVVPFECDNNRHGIGYWHALVKGTKMKINNLALAAVLCASSQFAVGQQAPGQFDLTRPTEANGQLSFSDSGLPEVSAFDQAPSPSDVSLPGLEPHSLPVSRDLGPSVVETVIDQATLDSVPHACDTPVMWEQGRTSMSPIARLLLRDPCNVARLWDGYPAQRQAECAAMWNCLNSHPGCRLCGKSDKPVNRYRSTTCDSCEGCSNCDSLASTNASSGLITDLPLQRTVSTQQSVQKQIAVQTLPPPPSSQTQDWQSRPSYQPVSGADVGPVAANQQQNQRPTPYSTVSIPFQIAR